MIKLVNTYINLLLIMFVSEESETAFPPNTEKLKEKVLTTENMENVFLF